MKAALANRLWLASCWPAWRRFQAARQDVAATQARWLSDTLRRNAQTVFGRRYGFDRITTAADFQRAVPLSTYDDYAADIAAIGDGATGVLTAERVRLFEPSSGSTAASKLIPYTASLQAEFQQGLGAWIYDLYTHLPSLQDGPAYWSITPLTGGERRTPGGLPIGFEADSAYLGRWSQALVESALAVPQPVKQIRDMAAFRYVTLLFLLREPELRLMSVWNPTYLSLLLEPLPGWWASLCDDVAHGTLSPPGELPADVRARLAQRLRADPRRAAALRAMHPAEYALIWPRLALISCWADGPAAPYAERLAHEQFPGVPVQAKGLLATEAFVSLPMWGADGGVLAVTSHFFEFLPETDPDTPRLAHQLERGERCTVVVTTGGGLYRYQLHDLVEVVGHSGQAPRLRFLGKTDQVSDWFGEKLAEGFVAAVLERLWRQHEVRPAFALLAPEDGPGRVRYVLYLEAEADPDAWARLAAGLEAALCENFHYAYCRRLGQLAASEVCPVGPGAAEAYLRACQDRGQKLGNIKPARLQRSTGWGERLREAVP